MQQLTMQDIAYIIGLYHQTNSRKQVSRELVCPNTVCGASESAEKRKRHPPKLMPFP